MAMISLENAKFLILTPHNNCCIVHWCENNQIFEDSLDFCYNTDVYTDHIIEAIGFTSLCHCIVNVCPISVSDNRDDDAWWLLMTKIMMMLTMQICIYADF